MHFAKPISNKTVQNKILKVSYVSYFAFLFKTQIPISGRLFINCLYILPGRKGIGLCTFYSITVKIKTTH
jgi:hypothetical protein